MTTVHLNTSQVMASSAAISIALRPISLAWASRVKPNCGSMSLFFSMSEVQRQNLNNFRPDVDSTRFHHILAASATKKPKAWGPRSCPASA